MWYTFWFWWLNFVFRNNNFQSLYYCAVVYLRRTEKSKKQVTQKLTVKLSQSFPYLVCGCSPFLLVYMFGTIWFQLLIISKTRCELTHDWILTLLLLSNFVFGKMIMCWIVKLSKANCLSKLDIFIFIFTSIFCFFFSGFMEM